MEERITAEIKRLHVAPTDDTDVSLFRLRATYSKHCRLPQGRLMRRAPSLPLPLPDGARPYSLKILPNIKHPRRCDTLPVTRDEAPVTCEAAVIHINAFKPAFQHTACLIDKHVSPAAYSVLSIAMHLASAMLAMTFL